MDTQEIDLRSVVEKGLERCRKGDWELGLDLLRKAARKEEKESTLPSLYYSYLGYGAARFDGARKDGLALCKHAIRMDDGEPENYMNLAKVCLLAGDRRQAVAAVQRGLKVDPRFLPLVALRHRMGFRRKPVIPFLSRDAWINRRLGERRHRRLEEKSQLA